MVGKNDDQAVKKVNHTDATVCKLLMRNAFFPYSCQ